MAWLRRFPVCNEPGCGKQATEELLTRRNEVWGSYCDRHAKARLKWLNAEETR